MEIGMLNFQSVINCAYATVRETHFKKSPQIPRQIKLETLHLQFPQQEPDRYAMLCI